MCCPVMVMSEWVMEVGSGWFDVGGREGKGGREYLWAGGKGVLMRQSRSELAGTTLIKRQSWLQRQGSRVGVYRTATVLA